MQIKEPPPRSTAMLVDIPKFLDQMLLWSGEKSTAATKLLYHLCDYGNQHNRVPMVCGEPLTYNVLTSLVQRLNRGDGGDGLHYACLTLNNLSIPNKNKAVLVAHEDLVGALCRVIGEDNSTSYVCCICLLNLALWKDNLAAILQYTPLKLKWQNSNPNSLVSIIGQLLTYPKNTDASTKTVLWMCALLKQLMKLKENAVILNATCIPRSMLHHIDATPTLPHDWVINSLEDHSLGVIANMSQWSDECGSSFRQTSNGRPWTDVIKPILWEDNVQGLKATIVCVSMGSSWSVFPYGGALGCAAIVEHIGNLLNCRDRDGYGDVGLCAAMEAFVQLTRLAQSALGSSGDSKAAMNVVATPVAASLCLQIIYLSIQDNADDTSECCLSAGNALEVLCCILPTLLQPFSASSSWQSRSQTKRAAREIRTVLLTYPKDSQNSWYVQRMAATLHDVAQSAAQPRPTLVESYQLWMTHRTTQADTWTERLDSEASGTEVDLDGPVSFVEPEQPSSSSSTASVWCTIS